MATSSTLYAAVVEHKHSYMADDTVVEVLRDITSRLPSTGRMFLDLSYNRLTVEGLKAVVMFMDKNPQASLDRLLHLGCTFRLRFLMSYW
jgi:hypothetical protein